MTCYEIKKELLEEPYLPSIKMNAISEKEEPEVPTNLIDKVHAIASKETTLLVSIAQD